jgi:CHASE2 domain-containing sensor protein
MDRSQAISALSDENASSARLKATIPQLKTRAIHVGWAIYWALGSGVATCFVIVAAFTGALIGVRHELGAAIFFTISLGLFTVALITFGFEIRAGISQVELD